MSRSRPRILWLLNHKTLMPFEVPVLISLGYEVFVPKVMPSSGFRSGMVSFEYDSSLSIPADDLKKLNEFDFYNEEWTPQIERLVNRYFACAFVIPHGRQVTEAIAKFDGQIVFRAFGLDNSKTYRDVLIAMYGVDILDRLKWLGNRFWFGEGYTSLHEIEDDWFKERAVFLPLGLPESFFLHDSSWRGGKTKVLFISPNAKNDQYYGSVYSNFKRDFGDIPHVIVGHQDVPVDDENMLGFVSDDEFTALLQECAALYYHSEEKRHVHYPPIEAAIVGLPVVYYKDSLFDRLCPESTMGAATSVEEARTILGRLLSGDHDFIDAVQRDQRKIVDAYQTDSLRQVWRENLEKSGLNKAIEDSSKRSTLVRSIMTFIPASIRERLEDESFYVPFKSPAIAKETLGRSLNDGVQFTESDLPEFVYSVAGLNEPEQFGRWSNGKTVTIALRHLLDTKFTLELYAFAYGKNAGAEVEVKIGNVVKTATFGSDYTNIVPARLAFSLRRPTNRIEIKIPFPTSPPNDIRTIGLALTRLQAYPI